MTNAHTPVAFVTGAARGIGLAIARWFFHQGYRVAVIDNDAPTLTATEATLRTELGARASDLLVIHDAGAYGASMSSNYNSRPLLPEFLLDQGELRIWLGNSHRDAR